MTTNNTNHLDDIDMLMEPDPPALDLVDPLPAPVPTQHSEQPRRNQNPPALAEEKTATPRPLDDMERMICHEDFPALLAKATKVKEIRQAMDLDTAPSATASTLDPNQVIAAVTRMKRALIDNVKELPIVRKGTYPLTDSMLQESFEVLQKELERCEEWYQQRKKLAGRGKRKADGEQIAVKYAKWQTDLLMTWMIEHKDYPFPNAEEITELGRKTNLTETQIINWTTNVRKRNLKATVEGGKKPHHFIDFVFLAHDRERRAAQGLDPAPVPQLKAKKGTSGRRKKASTRRRRKGIPPPPFVDGQPNHVPSEPLEPRRGGAFRPYPGGPICYAPPSLDSVRQPPQPPAPNGYQPHYQQPFPPPPYSYHAPPAAAAGPALAAHDGSNNLASLMSESFDETPVTTNRTFKHPDTLENFSSYWKHGEDEPQAQQQQQASFAPTNNQAVTRTDSVLAAAATLEQVMMADPATTTEQHDTQSARSTSVGTTTGRDSLGSIEMLDLNDSNCLIDEYEFAKNMTEI